ncbi:MAG TPA: hypothetical protein VFW73_13410 [Lacipirellulaceae bacterium]|nr:hypothetical protein [Lacipirellulaceae bacterium]
MASSFLTPYYLVLAAMNGIAALLMWRRYKPKAYFQVPLGAVTFRFTNALLWTIVAIGYVVLAAMCGTNMMPQMPMAFREFVNAHTGPVVYTVGTSTMLLVVFLFRSWFVRPGVAWTIWNLMLLFLGLSMPDPNFFAIVAKPDNVPIVALVFLLAFFTWLATYRAVENDRRMANGEPPLEKLDNEKVLVWPDLVYTEMICMIALSALLIFWAIWLRAPLEEPASSVKTPNPSKAPWYFLGLQEMLVYYDPWMAGVVLPSLIIVGLMAIPYIDFNKQGNGYYTINQRKFAYLIFQVGFLELWVTLIVLGTFLRGPNWNFFGPYEHWDPHKVQALTNVNLSEYFWQTWLGRSLPQAPSNSSFLAQLGAIVLRELPGILLVLGYFIVLPPLMAVTFLRKFYQRMGFIRYMVLATLILFMAALPIKMVLRWSFNLKYLIAIPEYFLNF